MEQILKLDSSCAMIIRLFLLEDRKVFKPFGFRGLDEKGLSRINFKQFPIDMEQGKSQ